MDKRRPNYDYIIFQIDEVFSVKDIMTKIEKLKFAPDIDKARQISQKCHYDIVPIGDSKNLHSYYNCKSDSLEDIAQGNLISGNTGITALLSYLEKKEFYFVLEYTNIVGFVNTSDLKKLISFLPIYVTSIYAEVAMRDFFRKEEAKHPGKENFLQDLFSQILEATEKFRVEKNNDKKKMLNFKGLQERFKKAEREEFYTDIYDELNFSQELAMCYFLKGRLSSKDDWDRIVKYKKIRNRTMHVKDQLLYKSAKENLKQILEFLNECKKIIEELSIT